MLSKKRRITLLSQISSNEVGKTLKPRVRFIINIQNSGAGLPDGGFYTAEEFQKLTKGELREGQLPARGAIEVKSTGEEVKNIAGSEQVMRYVNRYKQVLVTNYRDFVLVGVDLEGKVTNRESFSLAPNEKEFWLAASNARAAAEQQGERFVEYLKRVMLHAALLALPKGEAETWTPKDNRRWAILYKKVHIIIGSLFVPIGLAAWTGIIK